MQKVTPQPDWPESWKKAHFFVQQEDFFTTDRVGLTNLFRNRLERCLVAVEKVMAPPARVLDVGSNKGTFALALAEKGYRVVWNDLNDELADYVALRREKGEMEYLTGNVFDLSPAEPFDIVLATEIIEHFAHPDQLLHKIYSLLRPGGYALITTPNGDFFRNKLPKFSECADPSQYESVQFKPDSDGHIFLLYDYEMRDLAKRAGLEVVSLEFFNNLLGAGHFRLEPLLRLLPVGAPRIMERMTSGAGTWLRKKINIHMIAVLQKPGRD